MQHPPAELVGHTQRIATAPRSGQPRSSLTTAALDYHLPADRIATHPVDPRDSARMLVVWRSDAARIEHRHVRDLPEYLRADDVLVFNNTAVAPARLELRRSTGGRVEGLFLHDADSHVGAATAPTWSVMLRSGGRIAVGERLTLIDRDEHPSDLALRILAHDGDQWLAAVEGGDRAATLSTLAVLDRVGRTPLPPYIQKARAEHHETYDDVDDRRWYQTVYADAARQQSVAAPTAGMHFTPGLLARLAAAGAGRIDLTLHVGPGTFKPVTAATLDQHVMHSERYEVSESALAALRAMRPSAGVRPLALPPSRNERGGMIVAVGTTSARALESLPPIEALTEADCCGGISGMTDLLIAPPHQFRNLDGLLTNFHLPRSTLLALVAALVGLDRLLAIYREAIEREYRFYSYGDGMLILP